MVLGSIAILLGIVFMLDNFGYINAHDVLRYWPILLVVFGSVKAMQAGTPGSRTWGVVIAGIGVMMLLRRLDILSISLWQFWPLALVAVGGSIIWHTMTARKRVDSGGLSAEDESIVNGMAILGGFKRVNSSQNFRGGELTAIMGGVELDLRNASIKDGEAVLNVFAFWGGVGLRVPREWTVMLQGMPILGGYEDKTLPPQGPAIQRLVIKGSAVMGGVEISN